MICSYIDAQGVPHVHCLEIYNGNKLGYVAKQLEKLFWILNNTTLIEEKIGVVAVPRILVTFDNVNLMMKAMEYIQLATIFQVKGIEELILLELMKKFGMDSTPFEDELSLKNYTSSQSLLISSNLLIDSSIVRLMPSSSLFSIHTANPK